MQLLISVTAAFIIAEISKFMIESLRKRRLSWQSLTAYGGMPSIHAALVGSASAGVYLLEGISSLFIITLIFGLIVVRDAVVLRGAVSEQAVTLNRLLKRKQLEEILGHTGSQVLAGLAIGIATAILIFWL